MEERKTIHVIGPKGNLRNEMFTTLSTCRLGRKWLDALNIGEIVDLCQCETADGPHEIVGSAYITSLEHTTFDQVNNNHIVTNHSKSSSVSRVALTDAMHRAYGDKFSYNAPVTFVFYRRLT